MRSAAASPMSIAVCDFRTCLRANAAHALPRIFSPPPDLLRRTYWARENAVSAAVKNPDRITSATIATNRGTVSINPPKRKSGRDFPVPAILSYYIRGNLSRSQSRHAKFFLKIMPFLLFLRQRSSPGPPPMPQRYEKFYKF